MSTAERPLPIVLVGCGGIAGPYLQALPAVPSLRVCAVVEPDPRRRAAAEAASGAAGFASLDDLLRVRRSGELEAAAALVLTPPDRHAALAKALLEAGLHVLCEKPLATATADAGAMVAAADRTGRVLMMGSKFRYVADVVQARALLEAGAIGRAVLFENVFCTRVDMTGRWNGVRAIAGGGVLIDNGSHSVDVARHLVGPVARVQAQFGPRIQPVEVEDTARLLFEADSGVLGAVDLSWSVHKEVPYYVRVTGERGVLEIGWRGSRCRRQGEDAWTAFGTGYDKVQALASQLANFAGSMLGREQPLVTAADALASVQVIEAAYRSVREGRWQEVRE